MGYCVDCLECTLEIENVDLFMKLAGEEDYSRAMEDILGDFGFECDLPTSGRYPLLWIGEKYGRWVEDCLRQLAPSFVDGGYVSFIGEDLFIWRILVSDGEIEIKEGRVVFD